MVDNEENDPLQALKRAVVSQKAAALPDHPSDASLQDLHTHVVAYDRYVSETVIHVLSGGSQAAPYPQENELAQAIAQLPDSSGALVERYRRYKQRLDHMLALAIQVSRARQG